MKKTIITALCIIVLAACNSSEGGSKEKITDISADPVYQEGLSLVAKYKCLQCHAIDDALTGPSYRQIAEKYAGISDAQVTELGQKIISGGKGVWGEIFMTPHPDVTPEQARAMVKYILLLKK